jgi:hypothetical protein
MIDKVLKDPERREKFTQMLETIQNEPAIQAQVAKIKDAVKTRDVSKVGDNVEISIRILI